MKDTWRCDECGLEWRRECGSTSTCVALERAEERAEKAEARAERLEKALFRVENELVEGGDMDRLLLDVRAALAVGPMASVSPERARLDADGTAQPKTELVGVVAKGDGRTRTIHSGMVEEFMIRDTMTKARSEYQALPAHVKAQAERNRAVRMHADQRPSQARCDNPDCDAAHAELHGPRPYEVSSTEAASGVCHKCYCACGCCVDRVRGKLVPRTDNEAREIAASCCEYLARLHDSGAGGTPEERLRQAARMILAGDDKRAGNGGKQR